MSSPLIHTDLTLNDWQETTEVAPIIDRATRVATVRMPVVYHGSRQAVVQAFRVGAQNCPQGGTGMFCLGPSDIQLVTGTGRDPHWDVMVEWMGLHNQVSAPSGTGANYTFNAKIDWAHREKQYPEEVSTEGGEPVTIPPPTGFAPSGTSTGGNVRKAKRYDHLPTATIDVVMKSIQPPAPNHSTVKLILSTLPDNFPGIIEDYKGLSEPVWVSTKEYPAPKTVSGAVNNDRFWVVKQLTNADRVGASALVGSGESLWVFTVTATLEQRIQPS